MMWLIMCCKDCVIIKHVELFTNKNVEVIMINLAIMCLYYSSSCLISQQSTTKDFVHSCQAFEHFR